MKRFDMNEKGIKKTDEKDEDKISGGAYIKKRKNI